MKKDVLIRVRGLQMMDTEDEQEPLEIVVPGQYYYRNGSHYLRYEEMMEDEDCIQMKVDYALDMNDEHVADCYLTVQAQSKDLGDFSFYEN